MKGAKNQSTVITDSQTTYEQLLESKIKVAERHGIDVDPSALHPSTKPHQADIICWALNLGAALIAADCGMGKTHMAIEVSRILTERFGGRALIVTELGAAETFINPDPAIGEGARLGVPLCYVKSQTEADHSASRISVTNYERVRMGEFDFSQFTCVWLDEGNYIKNMASDTTDALHQQLRRVKFKYIATATPSPNDTLELINYAHVLGVCDRGQILTRFFQRNSTKAGELTVHPQHEDDFWLFVSSFAVFITRPSDLGHSDEGYELPGFDIHWHEVEIGKAIDAGANRDGQAQMFTDGAASLQEAARVKRESIDARLTKLIELDNLDPEAHKIFWHHLEDERKQLNHVYKGTGDYGDIFGSQPLEKREQRIVEFTKGELAKLGTKPELNGVGCNFQYHCAWAIYLGINHSWNDFYQTMCRILRFGQTRRVRFDVIYTREEYGIVCSLKEKWAQHDYERERMRAIVKRYGLSQRAQIEERRRSFMVNRKEWTGNAFTLVNTDCVQEFAQLADNSVDMILTSIPFGNHYEYTDKYNDFGHNATNEDFFRQMDFLVPHLLRVLKPGRIAAIHTKNRIHYGSVTGLGMSIMHRFTHAAADCFERHGFHTLGFHYVPTDVVAENNQTYRLTFGELKKDATKMGAGIPEEIWIFRKAPSSNANAYADDPVTKDDSYTLAHWQVDADCFWKSSGNRFLTPQELKAWGIDKLQAWWKGFNSEVVYDYEEHVTLLQSLDGAKKLSRTFTTLPLRSNTEHVWNDVNRMHGLNMEQSRRKQQNHICPMPFDQVDRLIKLYSNPGELIADPFGGLGTTGVRAIKWNRRAFLTELNETYAKNAHYYLKLQEQKAAIPTLFDCLTSENPAE